MKRGIAALVVTGVAAFGAISLAPATESFALTPVASAHTCGSSYVHAHLPWGQKCLRRGQFCKVSQDRYYHRFGFHCHTGRLR